MIRSFSCKGLQRFFETGKTTGIRARHARRLRLQPAALDSARSIEDMRIPGYHLHRLQGAAKARWSIRVSGNWRLTFEFDGRDAHVVDYEDYH